MCTLFARSLYPTLCSWIIRVDICRPLYPPKDNPWVKLPLIRSKMLLPFGHKQYFEADKQQNSNVSQSYFFSHKPTSEISDFSQSHTVGDTAGRSSLETKWRNCFFFSEFIARDKPISSILDLLSKILVNWFYKLNENSITDSNFSASLSSLKAIQHQQNKNSPLSRRNFRELNSLKIFTSYSVSF